MHRHVSSRKKNKKNKKKIDEYQPRTGTTKSKKTTGRRPRPNSRKRRAAKKKPITTAPQQTKKRKPKLKLNISSISVQGQREYQEDRVVVQRLAAYTHLVLLMVCDGHGGSRCSTFVAKRIPEVIDASLKRKKSSGVQSPNMVRILNSAIGEVSGEWDDIALGQGVVKTIVDDTTKSSVFDKFDMDKYVKDERDSGTTLCLIVIDVVRGIVYFANIGDSRAVLNVPGRPIVATTDHGVPKMVPKHLKESDFEVEFKDGRIAADIAMSRSIGDHTRDLTGVISRQPDIFKHSILDHMEHETEATMVVASDGLFDICSTQECFLNRRNDASRFIADFGGEEKFHDNTSVILVHFTLTPTAV